MRQRIRNILLLEMGKHIGTLYHFTSLLNAHSIVEYNTMTSDRETFDEYQEYIRRGVESKEFAISLTRNKDLDQMGISYVETPLTTRIALNGSKISNNYKISPVAFFGTPDRNAKPSAKSGKTLQDESEEIVRINTNYLSNVTKYIISIRPPTLKRFAQEVEYYIKLKDFKVKEDFYIEVENFFAKELGEFEEKNRTVYYKGTSEVNEYMNMMDAFIDSIPRKQFVARIYNGILADLRKFT